MKTTFYVMRHGQTVWNQELRFQGQLDSQLTDKGREDSKKTARELVNQSIDIIVSSPLGRAQQTAQICAKEFSKDQASSSITPIFVDALAERHLGAWQGEKISTLETKPQYHEFFHHFTEAKPQGGESAKGCAARMHQSLIQLAKSYVSKKVLVVTHGEAMRCLLAQLGLVHKNNAYQAVTNGQLFKIDFCHEHQVLQLTS